jgi:hypothetical protein
MLSVYVDRISGSHGSNAAASLVNAGDIQFSPAVDHLSVT